MAQGTAAGIQSIQAGKYREGFLQLGMALMPGTRGLNVCGFGRAAVLTNRAIMGATTVLQTAQSAEQIQGGDWFGGTVGLLGAGLGLYQASKACFVAGTPIKGEHGGRAVEEYKVGDRVWSRSENDPAGPVELKEIEEVFVRFAPVLHLHVGGQVIGTTGEHPFYAEGKGWIAAQELAGGDRVLTEDGRWVSVEEVFDTGEWQTVYNFRVQDHHTYFVGDVEWGIGVWAHNSNYATAMRAEGPGNERIIIHPDGSVEIPVVLQKNSGWKKRTQLEVDFNIGFDNFGRAVEFALGTRARGHTENNVKTFQVSREFLEMLRSTAILEHEVTSTPNGHLLP